MGRKELFEKVFCSDEHRLIDENDLQLGLFIYNTACEVFCTDEEDSSDESDDEDDGEDEKADTVSVESFEEKIVATKENFDKIVALFKKTRKAKGHFLRNFEKWAPGCKDQIQKLREIAVAIHCDKFNSDIAKLVGTVVATVGGIALALSYLTPLAVATVPLTIGGGVACGLGGITVAGTSITQIALLKKNLNEAKRDLKKHEENFSLMAHWFSMPEELKKTINSLVNYEILKEVGEDFKKFIDDVERKTNITIGDFKIRFKEVLKLCMNKMNKSGKVTMEFGDVFTPVVITFIFFFCILKGKNRVILDCILINENLALSIMSIMNIGVPAGHLANGLARGAAELSDDFFKFAFTKFLIGLSLAIDLISVVLNSIEIHKRPEPEQTKQLKKVAEQIEEMFLAIENVYNETKKFDSEVPKKWTTIFVESVPDAAGNEDIKMAVKSYLPDTMWDYIKIKRMNKGKNWIVKVPESHSEQLLLQSTLLIKEQSCKIAK